jgi:ABC-type multidrug transport system fused ATPase/permease subunit
MSNISLYLIEQIDSASSKKDLLTELMAFIYSIAHYIGFGIVRIINRILPMLKELDELADPIGFLTILTLFVILVSVTRKVAWIIVIAGWILIILRIVLMILGVR